MERRCLIRAGVIEQTQTEEERSSSSFSDIPPSLERILYYLPSLVESRKRETERGDRDRERRERERERRERQREGEGGEEGREGGGGRRGGGGAAQENRLGVGGVGGECERGV